MRSIPLERRGAGGNAASNVLGASQSNQLFLGRNIFSPIKVRLDWKAFSPTQVRLGQRLVRLFNEITAYCAIFLPGWEKDSEDAMKQIIARGKKERFGLLAVLLITALIPCTVRAVDPDFSGTWIARVARIGTDNCRRPSPRRLTLNVAVENKSTNTIRGVITGDDHTINGTGAHRPTNFNVWKVTNSQSSKYGSCNTQEGVYISKINVATMKARKVDFNHNVRCRKGSRHTYSCHYTYKGKARRS